MKYMAGHNELWVYSDIYFDEKIFCGKPCVNLFAHKIWDTDEYITYITISVFDDDDFDIGLIYDMDEPHFSSILQELVNWMRDHEQGISSYRKLINDPFDFFPDLGCKRRYW